MLLRWGEFQRALDTTREIMNDPKTLQPFAKRMRTRARSFIDGQGEGAWAPPAESTRKKWEQTGTSDVTKHGELRVAALRRLDRQIKRIQDAAARGGIGERERRSIARLRRRAEKLKRATGAAAAQLSDKEFALHKIQTRMDGLAERLRAAHKDPNKHKTAGKRARMLQQLLKLRERRVEAAKAVVEADKRTTYKGRDIGKREAETRRLMPRMAGTIRAKAEALGREVLQVRVYSKAGEVGYYHHTGQARGAPQRTIVPQANAEDLEFAAQLLEGKTIEPWEEK